ncbi:alpha/beta-hydrolase [Bimuria novae-zelandiae CBS 107.79]|uniref:Alpha/beta-hydrolase n=1 Tax=Bimuria novae-zelandiae CBS 107.79 TaxID=1447943 RepID=A0A6A5VK18_9PLEO|nr:alpha/beta-hydrolase [Bimuria novae-zelandiae CBS 107.79]
MWQLLFLPLLFLRALASPRPKPFGEQKYVDNKGVTVHYRKYAHCNPSAPYLLFQHGFPDQETTWNDFQIPVFSCYDIPSDVSDYTAAKYAYDILTILNDESITKATLIGHDFGGGIVQGFTQALPERVETLIIMNAPIFPTFVPQLNFDAEAQVYARCTIPYYTYVEGRARNRSNQNNI